MTDERRAALAADLGVSPESLKDLRVGWDSQEQCAVFPEYDEDRVVGLVRRYTDGKKRSKKGHRRGLTIPSTLDPRAGVILLVEGASDVASALTMGLAPIGRPSNCTGAEEIAKRISPRSAVLVVGENDQKNGAWPGRTGAIAVATQLSKLLGCPIRWVMVPGGHKDLRSWWKAHPDGVVGADAARRVGNALLRLLESDASAQAAVAAGVQGTSRRDLAYQPFPVNALPEPVRTFIEVSTASIGCDPSYLALPVLSVLAGLIGDSRVIMLKRGWTEPAIVWSAIVGASGTLKTPAFKTVMKPVHELQRDELRVYEDRCKDHELAKLEYEKSVAKWKRDDGQLDPPTEPQVPLAPRIIVSDVTVEALAVVLQENPRGVLAAIDELAGWATSFDRYRQGKGGDVAQYLSMHTGQTLIVDRKTGTRKLIHVERASVSICGGIQPGVLDRSMGIEHRENGLLARLLLAWPPRERKRWTEADIAPEVMAGIGDLYGKLRELRPATTSDGDEPVVLRLTPEAKRLWVEFYDELAAVQADLVDDDIAAAFSKLEAYAARFSLILHCVRMVTTDPGLASLDRVDVASVLGGITLARWFVHETERIYERFKSSEIDQERRELVDLIRRRGGSVTENDLAHGPRRYRAPGAARQALEDLVSSGHGKWMHPSAGSNGGRPSVRFVLQDRGAETRVALPGMRVSVPVPPRVSGAIYEIVPSATLRSRCHFGRGCATWP